MTTSSTSSVVSVASGTSAGAAGGSVINVSALVSELVSATQTPQQNLINSQTAAVTSKISALGTLKGALSTFQSSLSVLDTPHAFDSETATTSSTAFTATVTSGAPVGTYHVTVSQLASAQQLLSGQLGATGTSPVGTGTLQISLGSSSFNVTIGSSDNSLNGIAAAINSANGNTGVTATVLQGTDGAHLLLTSTQSGAANAIGVSETDSGTALSALTYNIADADANGNTANYTQEAPAQDAKYSVSGVAGSSPSNTITNALTNVTLNLVAKTGTDPATVTVATDSTTIQSNIAAFVTAYNTLLGTFSSLGSYDAASQTAGPMLGNALLSSTQNQMRSTLYSIVNTGSSTYNSLASIGITTNKDGTLSLNSATLSNALATNFSAVSALFSSPGGGIATSLNTQLNTDLGSTGAIASNTTSLTSQETALTKKTSDLTAQMAALSASLTQQYSALNNLLSSLQTTSAYLTQAFASLPQVQGKSSA
jgi:flagellar hook-associated protein 2